MNMEPKYYIEKLRLLPLDCYDYYKSIKSADETIPTSTRDGVNNYNPERLMSYLEQMNRACKRQGILRHVGMYLDYSTDPIGSLNRCPSREKTINKVISLGAMESVQGFIRHYFGVEFSGYLDKTENKLVEVDFLRLE